MTHTVKTIPGTWYTITSTAPATVTQQIDGQTATLATLTESGTTTFRASASTITIATDGKYHVLPTKAPAALSSGGNLTDKQKAELVESLVYEDVQVTARTGTGDTDMCVRWAQLSLAHEPGIAGELREVALPCRNSANAEMDTAPRYLGLWYEAADGTWPLLAISTAPATQVVGQATVWPFAGVEMVPGRKLRVRLLATATGTWDDAPLVLGGRGKGSDADGCYVNNTSGGNQSYMLELAVTVVQRVAKFAPASHASDSTVHITAAERAAWNEAAAQEITIDAAPVAGSAHAVSSGGVYNALSMTGVGANSIQIGRGAEAAGQDSVAIGALAKTLDQSATVLGYGASGSLDSTALGRGAVANDGTAVGSRASASGGCAVAVGRAAVASKANSTALGYGTDASGIFSLALGSGTKVAERGTAALGVFDSQSLNHHTLLYIMGAGTPLATTYEGGEACLGYIVADRGGNISASGTIKLSELCTNNAGTFCPTGFTLPS